MKGSKLKLVGGGLGSKVKAYMARESYWDKGRMLRVHSVIHTVKDSRFLRRGYMPRIRVHDLSHQAMERKGVSRTPISTTMVHLTRWRPKQPLHHTSLLIILQVCSEHRATLPLPSHLLTIIKPHPLMPDLHITNHPPSPTTRVTTPTTLEDTPLYTTTSKKPL